MSHIFISYSHKDTEYAHALADHLQSMGFNVWIDARLDYGSHWPHEIQTQLDSCHAFIIIMTPRAFASEWVQSELQRAKRKLKPIFPLLLEGDEPWLSVESTQFYDVRGGKFPDTKFYSALRRVIPVSSTSSTLHYVPKSARGMPAVRTPDQPPINVGKIAAAIGAALLICAVCAAVVAFPLARQWINASPLQAATEDSTGEILPPVLATATPSPAPFDVVPDIVTRDNEGMILIPAGDFVMGSDNGDPDEIPARTVYLDAFYMDVYEATNAQYEDCLNEGACYSLSQSDSNTRGNYFKNPEFAEYPVIHITWHLAKAYCEWRDARLPTEAEWEKAARGAEGRIYPWGNGFDGARLNFCDTNCLFNWANHEYDDEFVDTAPVDAYPQGMSVYGVFGLAGNVWEWVEDVYDVYPGGNPAASSDFGRGLRVLRGGSWNDNYYEARSSNRFRVNPDVEGDNTGVRCVRDAR